MPHPHPQARCVSFLAAFIITALLTTLLCFSVVKWQQLEFVCALVCVCVSVCVCVCALLMRTEMAVKTNCYLVLFELIWTLH